MESIHQKKWSDLTDFEKGYFQACFFTSDEDAPGGMDYRDTGRAQDLFLRIRPENLANQLDQCNRFQELNRETLELAGDSEQNGMDFWYTRNHHGVGFWDRGYLDSVSEKLTKSAHEFGDANCFIETDFIYIE